MEHSSARTSAPSQTDVKVSEDSARQLVNMGFGTPAVFAALRHEKNNMVCILL